MTGWDVASNIINQFPPLAMTFLSIAAVIVCIVGFSRNGIDFIRHGFNQHFLNEILSKLATKEELAKLATKEDIAKLATKEDVNRLETRIDKVESRLDKVETEMGSMKTEMGSMKIELATIKVNHFGHLKDFLSELTSILLDKGVFNNTEKTRLDNQLRGM
jgi:polyhydroxyalkanoate synthesis regulator phasin